MLSAMICFFLMTYSSGLSAGTFCMQYADGPYIIYLPDGGVRVITVNPENEIKDTIYHSLPADYNFNVITHDGDYSFQVDLHPVSRSTWMHEMSGKVFVMSDPHGRMDCVVSLLQGNQIIDTDLNWMFGNNHLVVIGDIFDRGDDVTQILWLFYKLEQEAAACGGQVSFLTGNHESMILGNNMKYATDKYSALAKLLGVEYSYLLGENTVLGQWLGTRNTIEKIGGDLYVHAGLSEEFYQKDLTIDEVNREVSRGLFMSRDQRKVHSPLMDFLFGSSGPLWYRGMVRSDEKYNPLSEDALVAILNKYGASRIIVGHTIFEDISSFYNGKVIDVNVNNQKNRDNASGRGLFIEDGKYYIVGDKGIIREIK